MTERPPPVTIVDAPSAAAIPEDVDRFLDGLAGPTVFRVAGRERARARVVAGTLHGNEPSGLRAIHRVLREGAIPSVDTLLFVGAVEAARTHPRHAHRMLPTRRDLNRCFRAPFEGPDGRIAEAALDVLRGARPELVLDLHNNTGHNPAYGVSKHIDGEHLQLVSLFANRVVHSRLCLGTFMEAFEGVAPAVTIECGRAGSADGDATAYAGLSRFLRLPGPEPVFISPEPMSILADPIRVCLAHDLSLAFGEIPVTGAALTLDAAIDRHNFETIAAGTRLGWIAPGAPWPLRALDERGADRSTDLFVADSGELRTRIAVVPIMMTTDVAVARSDCLFYAVHQRQ